MRGPTRPELLRLMRKAGAGPLPPGGNRAAVAAVGRGQLHFQVQLAALPSLQSKTHCAYTEPPPLAACGVISPVLASMLR